jgi:preprotein translocase subunit SecE
MDEFFQTLWANWGTIVAGIIGLILLVVAIRNLEAIRGFVREVVIELKKASWPWEPKEKGFKRYKELVDSTLIVVIAMLLMSGYVAFWDFMMVNIMNFLAR